MKHACIVALDFKNTLIHRLKNTCGVCRQNNVFNATIVWLQNVRWWMAWNSLFTQYDFILGIEKSWLKYCRIHSFYLAYTTDKAKHRGFCDFPIRYPEISRLIPWWRSPITESTREVVFFQWTDWCLLQLLPRMTTTTPLPQRNTHRSRRLRGQEPLPPVPSSSPRGVVGSIATPPSPLGAPPYP